MESAARLRRPPRAGAAPNRPRFPSCGPIASYEHLVVHEGCAWNLETVVRGAQERFVPILMTASVTGLGLLPLALQSGAAGREIEGPMACVILGGLVSSTLLNLLVLPSLAQRFMALRSPG